MKKRVQCERCSIIKGRNVYWGKYNGVYSDIKGLQERMKGKLLKECNRVSEDLKRKRKGFWEILISW